MAGLEEWSPSVLRGGGRNRLIDRAGYYSKSSEQAERATGRSPADQGVRPTVGTCRGMFAYDFCEGSSMKKTVWLCALALMCGARLIAQQPPVLDREFFFGDPEISGAQISPDGQYIAFLKPW